MKTIKKNEIEHIDELIFYKVQQLQQIPDNVRETAAKLVLESIKEWGDGDAKALIPGTVEYIHLYFDKN